MGDYGTELVEPAEPADPESAPATPANADPVEVTPLAVAAMEAASKTPLEDLLPWIKTVSPGYRAATPALALRVTFVDWPMVTDIHHSNTTDQKGNSSHGAQQDGESRGGGFGRTE